MTERLDGLFYTAEEQTKWGPYYLILMKLEKPLDKWLPNLHTSVAGFMYKAERDKYFETWTDEELLEFQRLTLHLWSLPSGMGREKTSKAIERIRDNVQRRAGIKNT